MSLSIKEVPLNPSYLIAKHKGQLDFCDVFQLKSSQLSDLLEPKDLMIAFFKSFPKSFTFLLYTRDRIAKLFNLKTAPAVAKHERMERLHAFKGNIGESVAIFEVLDKTDTELLTGQKDDHLDFKLSFVVDKQADVITIELATTVVLNNALGRAYFALVKPFHKFYLKRILAKMEKVLLHKDW